MRRLTWFLVVTLLIAGCSKSGKSPTAPTPDNPNPPVVTASVDWPVTPPAITLIAPSEDPVATSMYLSSSHPPYGGGVVIQNDLVTGTTLARGVPLTVHATTILGTTSQYVWQSGDLHILRVTVHRPGQKTNFLIELIHD